MGLAAGPLEATDAGALQNHVITSDQWAHALGRAGVDDVAGLQRPGLAEDADLAFDGVEHVLGAAMLAQLAIDVAGEFEILQVLLEVGLEIAKSRSARSSPSEIPATCDSAASSGISVPPPVSITTSSASW